MVLAGGFQRAARHVYVTQYTGYTGQIDGREKRNQGVGRRETKRFRWPDIAVATNSRVTNGRRVSTMVHLPSRFNWWILMKVIHYDLMHWDRHPASQLAGRPGERPGDRWTTGLGPVNEFNFWSRHRRREWTEPVASRFRPNRSVPTVANASRYCRSRPSTIFLFPVMRCAAARCNSSSSSSRRHELRNLREHNK